MKKRIQINFDDSQLDLVLFSLSNVDAKLTDKMEYLCSSNGDVTEFNNLLSLRNDVQDLKDKVLNQIRFYKFENYCNLDKIYHYLKLEHFEQKRIKSSENIIKPIFVEEVQVFDFDQMKQ